MDNTENKQETTAEQSSSTYYDKVPEFGQKGPSKIRQHLNRGITTFIVVAACLLFYFALLRATAISAFFKNILSILQPVIYGLAIAYLLNPVVKTIQGWLESPLKKYMKKEEKAENFAKGIGVVCSIALLIALVVALCNMMLPELFNSVRDMIFTVPAQLTDLMDRINEIYTDDSTIGTLLKNLLEQGTNYFQTWLRTDLLKQTNVLMTNLTAGVINIVSGLFDVVIGLIIAIYVLYDKNTFSSQSKKVVYAIFPPAKANMILHITTKSNEIFGGFIIGKLIDSLIIGILCFFGLSLLNMPYVMLVSVIVGVTNIIPFFGPYIGAVPSALLILLDDPRKGIYFIIFILILQQIDGNIIGPKILGNSTGLSAFWVVFAILIGGGIFGIPGMILGVPTFGVIYYICQMLLEHRLEKKHLPTDTELYSQHSYVDSDGDFIHREEEDSAHNKMDIAQIMKDWKYSVEETIEKVTHKNGDMQKDVKAREEKSGEESQAEETKVEEASKEESHIDESRKIESSENQSVKEESDK